ncbi:Rho guanine nucleotide exchange factor 40, partial [Larimichthys crocea]
DSESLDRCIQTALSALYPPFQATSPTVLCQVLSVVESCYRGDGLRYLLHFLLPAKQFLVNLQQDACLPFCGLLFRHEGWPLCLHEKVVIQLCSLDQHLLRPGDFYLLVSPPAPPPPRARGASCRSAVSSSPRLLLCSVSAGRHVEQQEVPELALRSLFSMAWLDSVNREREQRGASRLERCVLSAHGDVFRVPWEDLVYPQFMSRPLASLKEDMESPVKDGDVLRDSDTSQDVKLLPSTKTDQSAASSEGEDSEGEYVELTELPLPRFSPQKGSLTQSISLQHRTSTSTHSSWTSTQPISHTGLKENIKENLKQDSSVILTPVSSSSSSAPPEGGGTSEEHRGGTESNRSPNTEPAESTELREEEEEREEEREVMVSVNEGREKEKQESRKDENVLLHTAEEGGEKEEEEEKESIETEGEDEAEQVEVKEEVQVIIVQQSHERTQEEEVMKEEERGDLSRQLTPVQSHDPGPTEPEPAAAFPQLDLSAAPTGRVQSSQPCFYRVLLSSGALCLPGTRDRSGRALLTVCTRNTVWSNPDCDSAELLRLLLYYTSTLRKEVQALGLMVLVDTRRAAPVPALFSALRSLQDAELLLSRYKAVMCSILEDSRLVQLQQEGGASLSRLRREESAISVTEEYRAAVEEVSSLYDEVDELLHRLVTLSNSKTQELHFILDFRSLEEGFTQLQDFSQRVRTTGQNLERTVALYRFLDQAYGWALEGMRHLAGVSMDDCTLPNKCQAVIGCLEEYHRQHPPIPDERFQEMKAAAGELRGERGLCQWSFAWSKCQETKRMFDRKMEAALRTRDSAHRRSFASSRRSSFSSSCSPEEDALTSSPPRNYSSHSLLPITSTPAPTSSSTAQHTLLLRHLLRSSSSKDPADRAEVCSSSPSLPHLGSSASFTPSTYSSSSSSSLSSSRRQQLRKTQSFDCPSTPEAPRVLPVSSRPQ